MQTTDPESMQSTRVLEDRPIAPTPDMTSLPSLLPSSSVDRYNPLESFDQDEIMSPPSSSIQTHSGVSPPSRDRLDELLRKFGWRIHSDLGILICLQCSTTLNPNKVRQHVVSDHKELLPPGDLQQQYDEAVQFLYPQMTFPPPHPTQPVPVVPGLVMADVVQICSHCQHGYLPDKGLGANKPSRSFLKHRCPFGRDQADHAYTLSAGQRFNKGLPWFAVTRHITTPATQRNPLAIYQKMQAARPRRNAAVSVPYDYRVISQFLHKERWLEHVKGLRIELAIYLTSCNSKDKIFGTIPKRVHAYLAQYQPLIRSYHLKRLIGTRPTSEHSKSYERHHRAVNYDAHRKYSACIAGAIALLLRNIRAPNEDYCFTVPESISTVAHNLYRELENACLGPTISDDMDESNDPELESDDEDDEDSPVDQPILPHHLDETDEPSIQYPYGATERRPIPRFHDAVQHILSRLLRLLYTQNPNDGEDNPFRSVFMRYIVLSSLRADGNWSPPSVITQVMSAILFGGRITIAGIMLERRTNESEQSFDKLVIYHFSSIFC
jgi:hypothetical protein